MKMTREELLGLVDTKTKNDGKFVFDTDDKKKFAKKVIEFFCENFELDELTDKRTKDGFRFQYPESRRLFFAIKAGQIEVFLGREIIDNDNGLRPVGGVSGRHRILRKQVVKLLSDENRNEYLRQLIQESYTFCGGTRIIKKKS